MSGGKIRCAWVPEDNNLYRAYHDTEWGVPVTDDRKLFEFLVLESAQAGLSWYTILKKREAYRKAFADFDPVRVAAFGQRDMDRLLSDPGIVRNRLKIAAAVGNAKRFLDVADEHGSFSSYMWKWTDGTPIVNRWTDIAQLPAHTPLSDAIASDLKKRGFRFLGSTIIYAHMQATGMVNDHTVDCFRYAEVGMT